MLIQGDKIMEHINFLDDNESQVEIDTSKIIRKSKFLQKLFTEPCHVYETRIKLQPQDLYDSKFRKVENLKQKLSSEITDSISLLELKEMLISDFSKQQASTQNRITDRGFISLQHTVRQQQQESLNLDKITCLLQINSFE